MTLASFFKNIKLGMSIYFYVKNAYHYFLITGKIVHFTALSNSATSIIVVLHYLRCFFYKCLFFPSEIFILGVSMACALIYFTYDSSQYIFVWCTKCSTVSGVNLYVLWKLGLFVFWSLLYSYLPACSVLFVDTIFSPCERMI